VAAAGAGNGVAPFDVGEAAAQIAGE
jgi:hypothetical protein